MMPHCEGLPLPWSRACWSAQPAMADRGRHAVSGRAEGRGERPAMRHGQRRPAPAPEGLEQ